MKRIAIKSCVEKTMADCRSMLDLSPVVRIEDATMRIVRPLVGSLVIARDPCLQVRQHRVLLFWGRILVRLPRTPCVVGETRLEAWIEEHELAGPRRRGLDQLAVAALDHPRGICV